MRYSVFFVIFLSLTSLLTTCNQASMDYSAAENIELKWELVTNYVKEEGGAFEARFIMNNRSTFDLAENWKLFFNMAPRPIIESPSPQPATVEHINGDWYQMMPNTSFSLKKEIPFLCITYRTTSKKRLWQRKTKTSTATAELI